VKKLQKTQLILDIAKSWGDWIHSF